MPFAIELLFDTESENRITQLWHKLSGAGCNTLLLDIGSRPHIALSVTPELSPEKVVPALAAFAARQEPFSLHLSAAGTFPGDGGNVFLAPAASQALLQMHTDLHELLDTLGIDSDPLYRPGRWVAHCTVGMSIPDHLVGSAVALCQRSNVFGPVTATHLALFEYRPVTQIGKWPLGEDSNGETLG